VTPAEQARDYIARTYGTAVVSVSCNEGGKLVRAADGTLVTPEHLCPDLLRWENIGAADGPRGRAVRGFFWLLRAWKP